VRPAGESSPHLANVTTTKAMAKIPTAMKLIPTRSALDINGRGGPPPKPMTLFGGSITTIGLIVFGGSSTSGAGISGRGLSGIGFKLDQNERYG